MILDLWPSKMRVIYYVAHHIYVCKIEMGQEVTGISAYLHLVAVYYYISFAVYVFMYFLYF